MPGDMADGEAGCCDSCGGLVIRMRMKDGARYAVPVKEEALLELVFTRGDIDYFIFDRLRRAEKIITDLRKQLNVRTPYN